MQACGIDFGTSNSTVGVASVSGADLLALEGDAVTLPSAVFWHEDGVAEFGRAAIAAYVNREDGRLMRGLKSTLGSSLITERTRVGNKALSFREVLARYIGHLRARLVASAGDVPAVVMGRPVHFVEDDADGDARAEAVLGEIAREVGFREVAFQYEPIAAALHYESSVATEELVLIVDIGGGTSDVSLVRVGPNLRAKADRAADILGNDGIRVGGTDFDRLLSLAEVMPHLGFGTPTGGGRGIMPRHYYLDLATWHRINFLYTQRVAADLKALRHTADRPELLDRLIRVVSDRQGHALAMEVEAAKIALSEAEAVRLMLARLTGGPNPMASRAGFETAVAAPLARIADLLRAVLAQGGVAPDQVGTVFLTGGSSQLPILHAVVQQVLPGVRLATGDMLGSVGTGLALDAARKFA
ncbi:Hsp70 family protein [Gemmobacter fulvus]|uniref:Hsp70 family protein n=1 Tax=Gemmobacter fulvus TaxID=2840474 RepID=A0A975P824_9RHOB|nr:Hsp70 family protein [Gemmobacter fulvus]MBT9244718.1 Hsp70 family protein [Gemmobacter fulvus]QWK91570.1 Hsp70 family protein [Gemmobacter fulvus]